MNFLASSVEAFFFLSQIFAIVFVDDKAHT